MQHQLIGPLWGNIIIIAVAGVITVACKYRMGDAMGACWSRRETTSFL